jgi:ABC-type transport system involved in cytochrome c biogenesis permease component
MAMVLVATAIGESMRWGGAGSLSTSLMGTLMLSAFHSGLMVFFFFACPMATADTLARERREGTLGLLFLTSLTTTQVVMGKTAAQVVRSVALWLAVVPFLAIPFLLGGTTLADFARSLAAETAMVFTGLAAGFLGTSRATSWMGAIGAAAVWMIALVLMQGLLCTVVVIGVARLLTTSTEIPWEAWPMIPFGVAFASSGFAGLQSSLTGIAIGTIPTWVGVAVNWSLATMVLASLASFAGAIRLAAVLLERQMRREREGDLGKLTQLESQRETGYRRRNRRWMSVDPILWLELLSPSIRHGRWVLPVLVLILGGLVLPIRSYDRDVENWFLFVGPTLLVIEALLAAGSFRREIEEGTLEILLVTPLRPSSLVRGRRMALLVGIGPGVIAASLLSLVTQEQVQTGDWFLHTLCMVSSWLTLPWVGMRCAMRRLHPLNGWALTLAWGVLAPATVAGFMTAWLDAMSWVRSDITVFVISGVVAQWAGAIWWGRMTEWDLATRNYQLRPLARVRS